MAFCIFEFHVFVSPLSTSPLPILIKSTNRCSMVRPLCSSLVSVCPCLLHFCTSIWCTLPAVRHTPDVCLSPFPFPVPLDTSEILTPTDHQPVPQSPPLPLFSSSLSVSLLLPTIADPRQRHPDRRHPNRAPSIQFNSIQFNQVRRIHFIYFISQLLPPTSPFPLLPRPPSLSLSLSLTFSLRIFLDASRSRARLLLGLRRRLSAFHASSPSPNPGTPSTGRPA